MSLRKLSTHVIVCVLIASSLAPSAGAQLTAHLHKPDQPMRVYERIEWVIDPGQTYHNPFDPDEAAIDAVFQGPAGRTLTLPAFWSQPFTDNRFGHHDTRKATSAGEGQWLVRFSPVAAGKWTMHVTARQREGVRKSEPIEFQVTESPQAKGFIRRAPNNTRYLQFDSGQPFFPIGLNIAWPKSDTGLDDYERWFRQLSDAGGNFARIWMSHPNRMTETADAGIGRFDPAAMEYYDAVFELAEKHGISVMVTFNNHRDLLARDEYGESIWGRFPYNAATGGPATQPADFLTGRASRDFYKRRLRYVIARYSAFTNIAFWEFFNEQEFTRVEVPLDWMREMSEFMTSADPYRHLVTTSARIPPEQWQLPGMDFTQSHLYVGGSADLVGPVVDSARRHDRFNKPHVVGELGIGNGTDDRFDTRGVGTPIHNGIWASALSGAAGSSWHWWWDNYIEPKNLWHVYTGLSKFASAVDWPRRNFKPIDLALPLIADDGPEQFFDMTLACTQNWGYVVDGDVQVALNGRMDKALPHYFVSANKRELFRPVRLHVELPRPVQMVLRIKRVCDVGVMRVGIDDKPIVDFAFSALPGAADVKETRLRDGTPQIYEARLDTERSLEIPAGKHVITVANVGGDWVSLESILLRGAQSSRHQLATLALQDSSANETLAWIYDTRSHWQSDRDGIDPRQFASVSVAIPGVGSGPLTAEWWDTRRGAIIARADAAGDGSGNVKLVVPSFARDIALRLYPAGQR